MGNWADATPTRDPKLELIRLVAQLVREYHELYGDWPSEQWLAERIHGAPE